MTEIAGKETMMRQATMFLILLIGLQPSQAARVEFYEGARAKQNLEGTLSDTRKIRRGVGAMGWDNDEIKSVRLRWVAPGTRIRLFDSPSGSKNDDWIEIRVKNWSKEIIIDHLEPQKDDPWVSSYHHSVEYHPQMVNVISGPTGLSSGKKVEHRDLNGKVSRIEIDPGVPTNTPIEARLERCFYSVYRFEDKRGSAHEFLSQDSKYRLWFPDYSVKSNGNVVVTLKIDHMRGGYKDDHGQLRMVFDATGVLTDSNVDISFSDAGKIKTSLKEVWANVPDSVKTNKAVMISEASTKIAAELYSLASDLTDDGGRKNFSGAVEHVMTEMGTALGTPGNEMCIPEPEPISWPTVR